MYCSKCGAENPDNAKFCGKCGEPIAAAGTDVSPPTPTPTTSVEQVSGGLKWGIIAASFIIPAVGIIMGIIYLVNDNPNKKSAGKLWLIAGLVLSVLWWIFFVVMSASMQSSYYY